VSRLPRYKRWCLALATVLHVNLLVLPYVWARLHSTAEPETVQVFLVQSQAEIIAPALSRASAKAAPKVPRQVTPPVRTSNSAIAQAAASADDTVRAANASTLAAEAGAPPAELPRFDAAYLNNQAPLYPPLSRRSGEQGRVQLRVHVTPDGGASEVLLGRSSGYPRLDAAARRAVERWKFVPARRGDVAVDAWVIVPISFSLEG
jgi:protein TonB